MSDIWVGLKIVKKITNWMKKLVSKERILKTGQSSKLLNTQLTQRQKWVATDHLFAKSRLKLK